MVQITLVPRANAKKDPLPGRVEGSNPYLVDPAEYYRQFPKKTLKEFDKGPTRITREKRTRRSQHYLKGARDFADFYPAHNNLGSIYLASQKFNDLAQASSRPR
jgi:hypothetical protein